MNTTRTMRAFYFLVFLDACAGAPQPGEPSILEEFTIVSTWPGDALPPKNPGIQSKQHILSAGWSQDSSLFMFCNPEDPIGTTCTFTKPFESHWEELAEGAKIFKSSSEERPEKLSTYNEKTKSIDPAKEKELEERKTKFHATSKTIEGLSLVFTTNASPNETKITIESQTPDKKRDFVFSDSINRLGEQHIDAVQVSPDGKFVAVIIHSNRYYGAKLVEMKEILPPKQ
jgi:hypothetical protein